MSAVESSIRDSLATVTIDAPPVNALDPDGWFAIRETIVELSANEDIRAIVLQGASGRFCAGADISVLAEPQDQTAFMLRIVGEAATAIRGCRVPVIAAIDGPAHGGGLELALACDIAVASSRATFAASGVNMGLIASVPALTASVGVTRASRMLLTSERIDATTAERWSLITLLDDDPSNRAHELAQTIASKAPLAVEANKAALRSYGSVTSDEYEALVTQLFAELEGTADHREAVEAFLNKRPPNFGRA